MKHSTLLVIGLVANFMLAGGAVAQDAAKQTIAETAVKAGQFTKLVAAVKAAGLLKTLSGDGPFTVLAPTDEAFAKLPKGSVESLLKPENKDKLATILKLHVASGELTSDMATPDAEFPSLDGTKLKVAVDGKKISVGGASVVKADIACSNGVIHVIDTVILPQTPLKAKALVGKWTYARAVKNGEKRTEEQLSGQSVVITEKTWTLDGDAKFVMDYTIDSKSSPNKIKFTITESPFGAGMSTGGVIKMDGDMVVVCYSAQGGDAPEEFKSETGSGNHMFYLKKSK
ncbi:MAG: hypothetical protein Aurels2KO_51690 [Aureliella sp.]